MGLGSGIRKKPIPDPGVQKAPDPGSRIRIRNTGQSIQKISSFVAAGCRTEGVPCGSEEQAVILHSQLSLNPERKS